MISGIKFEASSTNVQIKDNVFEGNGLNQCYAIDTSGGSPTSGIITGNRFIKAKVNYGGVPQSGNTSH